jgi:tripartite-type tricarboxylate transporter receptor subunit TctC
MALPSMAKLMSFACQGQGIICSHLLSVRPTENSMELAVDGQKKSLVMQAILTGTECRSLTRWMRRLCCVLGLLALSLGSAPAREAAPFQGKTVRVIVGASAGGGFDTYSRILAQFLGKHIAGNPLVIVQNMSGAGSLSAANYISNVAPKDGTVIGALNPAIVTDALFYPDRVKFDARKVKWIGSALRETHVALAWYKSPIRNFDDVFRRQFVVAGSGGTSNIYPMLMNAVLGTRFKLVAGYPGTAEGNLAMQRGEVDGNGGITWASVKATQGQELRDKNLRILVQYGLNKHKELPDVPWIFDYARNAPDRAALTLVLSTQEFGRPFMVAQGVPDNVVAILRNAFDETMKAADFREEATRRGLDLDPANGADIQGLVDAIYKTSPEVVTRVKKILDAAGR